MLGPKAFLHSSARSRQSGFTLIELVLVVVLIALISTFAVTRVDSLMLWKTEGDIRNFANLWQFLFNEAFSRSEAYRLVIDLEQDSYYVRREVPLEDNASVDVDYLANLRTKSEKERRARKEEEELLSLDKEFEEEDLRQSGALDSLYYQTLFRDPEGPKRLARPLEFPSLAKEQFLTQGLVFRDVVVNGEKTETGRIFLRLSPRGAAEAAVVHLEINEQIFSVAINPATGRVFVSEGDLDFEEALKTGYEKKS